MNVTEMETDAPGEAWRTTSGAEPGAVKAASPVLNGEDEETGRKALRLVLTQRKAYGIPGFFSSGLITCICGLRKRGVLFPPHPLPAREFVIRTSVCERITTTLCPSGDACSASCHRRKREMMHQNSFPERGAAPKWRPKEDRS